MVEWQLRRPTSWPRLAAVNLSTSEPELVSLSRVSAGNTLAWQCLQLPCSHPVWLLSVT